MSRLLLLGVILSLVNGVALADDKQARKSKLDGAWQFFASVRQDAVALTGTEPRTQLLFRGNKVVYLVDEKNHVGIPYSGAEFDVKVDRTKTPHRLALSFNEGGGEEVFAYCIFQRSGDKLLLKMLLTLGLDSNGEKKDFERFAKDPYPQDFSPPPNKFELLILLKKTKDVIPIPRN